MSPRRDNAEEHKCGWRRKHLESKANEKRATHIIITQVICNFFNVELYVVSLREGMSNPQACRIGLQVCQNILLTSPMMRFIRAKNSHKLFIPTQSMKVAALRAAATANEEDHP